VQIRVKALALNYLDVWGFRGMAFAKRKMPQAAGVEASGEIAAVGEGVSRFKAGDPVTMYGADTCGHCKACREGGTISARTSPASWAFTSTASPASF
jgi:NADPH:quinone reductase-like Zn-dependent oxidoreductase